jgi:protoporphyrinogen/coproporphyrinogen III oxidase
MVIVIGGGITGLAAAFELQQRGVPVTVVEASDRTGGLIHTEHVDGYTIEAGADAMLVEKPSAIQLCEELGLGSQLITTLAPRHAYVYARGRLHALPSPSIFGIPTTVAGIATYDLLPWTARLRLAAGILRRGSDLDFFGRAQKSRSDPSVAEVFRGRFGAATVSLIAEPLIGGIHAGDVEQLSMRAVAPRLLERGGWHLRPFTRRPQADGPFRSLANGLGDLVNAIERRLPDGSVHLNCRVTAVSRRMGHWRVECGPDQPAFEGRAVIVAAPAHAAAQILVGVDPTVADLCAQVPYVSTLSVTLAWPRQQVAQRLAGSGFVVARRHSSLRITACTWVSSKWPGRAPPDGVLLRAFLGGAHDPSAVDLSDRDAIDTAVRDLSVVLGITGAPHLTRVYRWRQAGAQHHVGHASRVALIEEHLREVAGLYVAGSGFRATGIPDCIADGRARGSEAARYVKMSR